MSTLKSKACATCKRVILSKRKDSIYCSKSCRNIASRKRAARTPRTCPCGMVFSAGKRGSKKFCSKTCAKRADNSTQRERRKAEEAAKELWRRKQAGEIRAAAFAEAAAKLGLKPNDSSPSIGRATAGDVSEAERLIQQALFDEEATRRAQVVRNEPAGWDPAQEPGFSDDLAFLRREAAIAEHLASKMGGSGQGPSIAVMRMIRDREVDNG